MLPQPLSRRTVDIVVVNCNTSATMTAAIASAARSVAGPDTHITAVHPEWGVESVEGFYESFVSAAAVLDLLTTRLGPCDGVVMAGFGEHGREGARQLMSVPVVDITEAAAFSACLLGMTFGVVTTTATAIQQIRQTLATIGLLSRCVQVRATGMRVLDLDNDLDKSVATFTGEGRRLIDDGAEVIVLGCAGMAGLQERVQEQLGVPVVDGVAAAVTFCEALIRQGLRTSKVGSLAAPDLLKNTTGWPLTRPTLAAGTNASGMGG